MRSSTAGPTCASCWPRGGAPPSIRARLELTAWRRSWPNRITPLTSFGHWYVPTELREWDEPASNGSSAPGGRGLTVEARPAPNCHKALVLVFGSRMVSMGVPKVAAEPAPGDTQEVSLTAQPLRILLAAKDDDQTQSIRAALTASTSPRFQVEHASNGWSAQRQAAEGTYDALILDYRLSGTDGLTLLARLKGMGMSAPALLLTPPGWDHATVA